MSTRGHQRRLRVGVIFGGRSGEHEVSLASAASVLRALDPKRYDVLPIGIAKDGRWIAGPRALLALQQGQGSALSASTLLPQPGQGRGVIAAGRTTVANLRPDVVIPLVHGTYGEDGTLQGLLELADIAYVGAGVLGSAVGMDKVVQKQLCQQAQLPVVKYVWFLDTQWRRQRARLIRQMQRELGYPVFVKPANLGSSVGISKCKDRRQLVRGIREAAAYDRKVLVEAAVPRAREIEVAVLGNDDPRASVAGEIVPSNEFYDYDAKYVDAKSQAYIPAKLSPRVHAAVRRLAVLAFKVLNLSGMARVDFLVSRPGGAVYLNEVNTIPGFTSISMYPKLWAATGLSYPALLDRLIQLALERHAQIVQRRTDYTPKSDWYRAKG